jgi:hypothetical protein
VQEELSLFAITATAFLQYRLEEGDSFLREIVSKGKVLYEKADAGVGEEG